LSSASEIQCAPYNVHSVVYVNMSYRIEGGFVYVA